MRRRNLLVVSLFVLIGLVTACGDANRASSDCDDGDGRFPNETFADWKTYADHIVTFTVIDAIEERVVVPEDLPSTDETVTRIKLRIDEVLWSSKAAPELPATLMMLPAWNYSVGDSFLSPLTLWDDIGPSHWAPLTACAPAEIRNGKVTLSQPPGDPVTRQRIAGWKVAEILEEFLDTPPDPRARRHMRLRPHDRVREVLCPSCDS